MPSESTRPSTSAELSLQEMLRILDEARLLRTDRELIERELNREQEIASLRERLLETTRVTGETATPAEIDAAIRIYYENRHTFEPRVTGGRLLLAYLYIWRSWLTTLVFVLVLSVSLVWFLFVRNAAPLSSAAFTSRAVAALVSQIESVDRRIAGIARVPVEPDRALPSLQKSANVEELEKLLGTRQQLLTQLEQEFEVRIPSGANERSGVDRYFTDDSGTRVSGYYLILKAIRKDGRLERILIRDIESGRTEYAERWGERVPEEIYNRVKQDKEVDAIVDDNLFAVKNRGELDWQVKMTDSSGQPLKRVGQILDVPN